MKEQPKQFTGTKPAVEKVEKSAEFSIPVGKIVFGMVIGSIVVAAVTIVTLNGYKEYQSWNRAWSQVQFAKQNPEIVRVVQERYTAKLQGVQNEFLATQSATVQLETPKE